MKKKILIIFLVIIFVTIGICYFVFNSSEVRKENGTIEYSKDDIGSKYVETGHLGEIEPDGSRVVLVTPAEETKRTEEDRIKEKNATLIEKEADGQEVEYKEYELSDQMKVDADNVQNKENRVIELLNQYYGEDVINELFGRIKSETNNADFDVYKFPESGKELLQKIIELAESDAISEEDRDALKFVAQSMDLTTLEDDELKEKVNNLK